MDEFGNPQQNPPESFQPVEEAIQRERTMQPQSGSIKAGEVEATFSVLEGAPYTRSRRWIWTMLFVVVVLLAVAFGFDGWNSISMAVAFAALIGVYAMTIKRAEPGRRIPMILTTYGLQLEGNFYPYTQFSYFYMLEFPDYVKITLHRETRFSTGIEVFLLPTDNVEEIRTTIRTHIAENLEAKETSVQRLVRLLQL